MQFFFCSLLLLTSIFIFLKALHKSANKQFFTDTPFLFWLGIYVWGDALVLAPFWAISSLLFLLLTLFNNLSLGYILRYMIIFFAVRSFFEVIYWLNVQASGKLKKTNSERQTIYQASLFKKIEWIGWEESAILYQLIHMCVVLWGLVGVVVLS